MNYDKYHLNLNIIYAIQKYISYFSILGQVVGNNDITPSNDRLSFFLFCCSCPILLASKVKKSATLSGRGAFYNPPGRDVVFLLSGPMLSFILTIKRRIARKRVQIADLLPIRNECTL